jgi:hypothetical protein
MLQIATVLERKSKKGKWFLHVIYDNGKRGWFRHAVANRRINADTTFVVEHITAKLWNAKTNMVYRIIT